MTVSMALEKALGNLINQDAGLDWHLKMHWDMMLRELQLYINIFHFMLKLIRKVNMQLDCFITTHIKVYLIWVLKRMDIGNLTVTIVLMVEILIYLLSMAQPSKRLYKNTWI
jgi:hypothetical protein